jgi:sugar/nucleoside kinase (ribokinase family)
MQLPEYIVVGHITRDRQKDGRFLTGGTVSYASVTAHRLGLQAGIITASAPDLVLPPEMEGIQTYIQPSKFTSTFRNEYPNGRRKQYIEQAGKRIDPEDIPAAWKKAPLVHLAPLTQEVPQSITHHFATASFMATPQGWMRYWDGDGIVHLGNWLGADALLPQLTTVVASTEDIQDNWSMADEWAKQARIVIITEGDKGCTVYYNKEKRRISPRPAHVVDPTGAGDVFAAAFHIRWREIGDPWMAAYFANIVASMSIEEPGLPGIPSRQEVEKYLASNPYQS